MLTIVVPPLSEQRRIADILGAFDHKIELNRRTNETMAATARALFKSWFIDFDPVRAKAAGRKPDAATAALFPATFESSPLGETPKGWKVSTVKDLAILTRDSLNPSKFADETFCHFSIPAFDDGQRPAIESGSAIKSNKFVVSNRCVLVSKLNPRIPRIWLPDLTAPYRPISSTEFLVMLPLEDISREYIYCLFSSESFSSELATLVTGTSGSHQRVKPESVLAMRTLIPPKAIIDRFTASIRPILGRVAANRRESVALAAARDALLPKLLSGELSA